VNEGGSIATRGCVFEGLGVLSRTISETGASSRATGVVNWDELACLREMGVEGNPSVTIGKHSGGSFGDDLSTTVNGVSGTEDGDGERVRCRGSSRRLPRLSVTVEATGVGGSAPKEGPSPAARSAGWGAPPRLTLNLEGLFLTLGGGREDGPCSTA